MRDSFLQHGMSENKSHRDSDIIIVNTCTVTHRSDQQVRQTVRRLHRENPSARVIVTGCYAQRDPEGLAAIPGVNLVVGNAGKERLYEILDNSEAPMQGKVVWSPLKEVEEDYTLTPMAHTGGKTRPLVKLQDGCDARCSYCIVPHVRGPGRSAAPENIISEIHSLVRAGFQEIVLTGVNLGTYGRKTKERMRLSALLTRILQIPQLGRIRLSSIEPMLFERSIIDLAASNPVFAHHFHVPIQSGSDQVLRRMRRPYRAERLRQLFEYIHTSLPDAGLGTDILVGFPGETEMEFAETCELIQNLPLTYLHVFPFSPREGTEAYSYSSRITPAEMKQRIAVLIEISRSKNLEFRRRFLGKTLPAITLAKEEDLGTSVVLTGNYIHVRVPGISVPPNRLVEVRIEDAQPAATYGTVMES